MVSMIAFSFLLLLIQNLFLWLAIDLDKHGILQQAWKPYKARESGWWDPLWTCSNFKFA
jgi:hypothetical protein